VRISLLGAAFLTVWLAIAVPADPLQLFLWAMTFSAAAAFPVLLLSVWWKRMNAWGALAGMVGGVGVTAFVILLCETGAVVLPSALAGIIGMLASFGVAIGASLTSPAPSRAALEVINDVRVPGGETLYDRETRLARLKKRAPP
jgi:cation/acetate symporter